MSRKNRNRVNEVKDDQVIEGEIVEETEEETPEVEEKTEKKPSKARALWKKGKWILLGAGIAGLAFFAGRSSGNDELALERLGDEYIDRGEAEGFDDEDAEKAESDEASTEE